MCIEYYCYCGEFIYFDVCAVVPNGAKCKVEKITIHTDGFHIYRICLTCLFMKKPPKLWAWHTDNEVVRSLWRASRRKAQLYLLMKKQGMCNDVFKLFYEYFKYNI